ncbi:MAG TPA: ABC transporter substrate-binding protein [Bacillales bacterium]|nr:ABC transporter substrate-binding protein [Bacillales bacterium]
MKRKSLLMLFSLLLLIGTILTGCGGGDNKASTSQQSETSGNSSNSNSETTVKQYSQGVTDQTIKIGNWATQSGAAAMYGPIAKGIDAYLKYVNNQGGVNGRNFEFVTYDEEYQPSRAVAIARKLIQEDKVFAIVGNDCTSCNKAALPLFKDSGVLVVGVSSGSDLFVNPVTQNVFGLLTNYAVEGRIFARYAVDELGAKKVGIFYQNDDFGKSGYLAAKDELAKIGAKLVEEIPYNSTDVDYKSGAIKMKEAKPDIVLSFSITKPTASIKKELHDIGVNVPFIVTGVTGSDNSLFELAGNAWTNVYSSSWLNLIGSDDDKVNAYVETLNKYYPNVNPSGPAQWGWAEAEVLVEGIKRAGDDLTWGNVIKQLESMDKWNEGMAFNVTYGPDNHYGSTSVFIIKDQDGQMVKQSDILTYEVEK